MVEDWGKVNILKSEKKKPVPHNLEDDPVFGKKKKKCGIYSMQGGKKGLWLEERRKLQWFLGIRLW